MGNTTIIEINHDQTQEIEDDREAFVNCVLEQCRAATFTGKRIPGGRVTMFFHRSGQIEKEWCNFKHKWERRKL
ncbi:hypothetical protein LCGC14_2811800 [marine sediment metagenome]|uniref:Uncharacterized protein n=1 Tax=marine sediment metagenome TaxID=412755 RepID=A0A0F8YJL8_9ZZZZ